MLHTTKLGVCTWTFGEMPLDEIARRVGALGLDGIELMGDLERYKPAQAKKTLRDNGLSAFSLTPDNVDLAHPDKTIRSAAVDYYLRLLDFAGEMGGPLVSCHGYVGRVRAISSQQEEYNLLASSVRRIAERAKDLNIRMAIEVLNRYEAHLLNTADDALGFVNAIGSDNVGILLDAYHMNIEEPDPSAALRHVADRLWLYHAADSNRQGIGRGHTEFASQVTALTDIGYRGPIILECTAPGPDPFAAIKDSDSLGWLETYLRESRQWLRSALYSKRV